MYTSVLIKKPRKVGYFSLNLNSFHAKLFVSKLNSFTHAYSWGTIWIIYVDCEFKMKVEVYLMPNFFVYENVWMFISIKSILLYMWNMNAALL